MTQAAAQHQFENVLTADQPAFLSQHSLFNKPVLPFAAVVDWVTAAASHVYCDGADAWSVQDLTIKQAIALTGEMVRIQTTVANGDGRFDVRCFSDMGETSSPRWKEHVSAVVAPVKGSEPGANQIPRDAAERWPELPLDHYYDQLKQAGLRYGPLLQGLKRLWREGQEALAWIEGPESFDADSSYLLHPLVLDACFHALGAFAGELETEHLLLPVYMRQALVRGKLPRKLWCVVHWQGSVRPGCYEADFSLYDEAWSELARIEGVQFADVLQERSYAVLIADDVSTDETARRAQAIRAQLDTLTTDEAKAQFVDYLLLLVSRIVKLSAENQADLKPTFARLPVNELGLDSLMGVRLRNRILSECGVDIPVQMFIGGSSAAEIVDVIYRQSVLNQLTKEGGADAAGGEMEEFVL